MNMNRKLPISNTDSNNIKTSKFATKIGQNKKKKESTDLATPNSE
jgi:hypothetical protein